MVSSDAALALAQLAGVVLGADDLPSALTRVTLVAVEVVPGCDACSLTMRMAGRPEAPATSDAWSRELDELQYSEQEGPCLDCMREGSIQRVRDFTDDSRFPSYGPRAAAKGARSALSLPLTADGRTVGALNLYSRQPAAFGSEEVAAGELLAAHASLAVQAATAYYSSVELAAQMRDALVSRAVIEQAKGVLVAQQQIAPDDAFALLTRLSQQSNRKLREVAAALVDSAARGA